MQLLTDKRRRTDKPAVARTDEQSRPRHGSTDHGIFQRRSPESTLDPIPVRAPRQGLEKMAGQRLGDVAGARHHATQRAVGAVDHVSRLRTRGWLFLLLADIRPAPTTIPRLRAAVTTALEMLRPIGSPSISVDISTGSNSARLATVIRPESLFRNAAMLRNHGGGLDTPGPRARVGPGTHPQRASLIIKIAQ